MRLPFEAGAAEELEAIVTWYERERAGYGALFVSELQRSVDRAAQFPQSGVSVPGFDSKLDVRRFTLKRFPYSVVTAVVSERCAVIAIAHGRRRPGYWRDRLPPPASG